MASLLQPKITSTNKNVQHRSAMAILKKSLFWLVLLINALPILGVPIFYTGDGPAHLYNAALIQELLSSQDTPISEFFELRRALLPNMLGHIILSVLLLIFDPAWAEKILACIIMLSLAVGFRYAGVRSKSEFSWTVLLVFPLLHHFCFYIGFQSFSLGLGLMLCCIGYYERLKLSGGTIRSYIVLSALLFLTACSHLVPLLFFLIFWALREIPSWLAQKQIHFGSLLALIPATLLTAGFMLLHREESEWMIPSFIHQAQAFFDFQALIPHHLQEQRLPALMYVILLASLSGYVIFAKKAKNNHSLWMAALSLFILYFMVPSEFASGGFIGIRLMLGLYIFWALWLSQFKISAGPGMVVVMALLIINGLQVHYNFKQSQYHSTYAEAMRESAQHIPAQAVVVPLNYATHWMHYNVGLYASAFGTSVNMDNYEASEPHFPVKWRTGMAPGSRLGDFGSSRNPPFSLVPFESETDKKVEVVVRCFYDQLLNPDSTSRNTEALLHHHFTLEAQGEGYEVWLRKPL